MKEKTLDKIIYILTIILIAGFILNLIFKTFIPILLIECILIFLIFYEYIVFYNASVKKEALFLFLIISFATLIDPLIMKMMGYHIKFTLKLSVFVNSIVGFFGFLGIFVGYLIKKKEE